MTTTNVKPETFARRGIPTRRTLSPCAATSILLTYGIIGQAFATDLPSSTTAYSLTAAANPYVVVAGATIDTRADGTTAISGSSANATWTLTNNGTVDGGFWALQFNQPATVNNNGVFFSPATTALALFGGGTVVNAAGAVIAGKLDGIYAAQSFGKVVNAGTIAGDVFGLVDSQSGIHMPDGGTVINLATGRIGGYGSAILAAPATTVMNDGTIASGSGPAIDLTAGTSNTGGFVANNGTIASSGGVAIRFGPNDDTLLITGASSISGTVDGGGQSAGGGNTLILGGTTAGKFDLSSIGANAQYRNFNILRKQDASVWTMTGTNSVDELWQMAGGGLVVAGQLTGGISAAPQSVGLDVEVASGGAIHAPTGSAVSLGAASRIANNGAIDGHADKISTLNVQGAGSSIVNTGIVTADGAGAPGISIDAQGGEAALINNVGASISSVQDVAVMGGSNVDIMNAGTLWGRSAAVRFTGSNDVLTLDTGSNVSGDLDGGNGANNALVLQGTGRLASPAYGFSSLAMRGVDWTLASTASAGTTTIETGTLRVNGALTSPTVTVASGAALAGTGTVTGALVTQGTIAPGDAIFAQGGTAAPALPPIAVGTLHVNGTYTQSAGSQYQMDVSPTANDMIDVTGPATLNGGTVLARLRAGSLSTSDTYTIVAASAGLTGAFAGVSTLNPFVRPSLAYDANHAYLVVKRGFRLAGGTPNEIAVEGALDRGIAGLASNAPRDRDFLTVAVDLLNLEGPAAYAALDQLSAEAYTALLNAHIDAVRLTTGAIDARLTDARSGSCSPSVQPAQVSGSGDSRFCSWAVLIGNTGKIGGYDTWLTQRIDLAGVTTGLDYRVAAPLTLGAALSYVHGNTSTDTLPVHGQFDSYQAALYASYVPGRYWLNTAIGYARNDDAMKRDITFTDPMRTAQGSTGGNQYFASRRTGIDLAAGAIGVLSPFVGFDAQYVEGSGFTESGADSVNLAVQSASASAVRSLLGTQWRHAFDWFGHAWRVDASAAWAHEYGALTRAINASFAGAPGSGFTVHGSGPARDAAQLGVGASIEIARRAQLFARYDVEFGARTVMHAGSVGFDYHW
ncbi:autotransporter domain-containing protein [Paraburkholderia phymatum]|uniref:autotransporter outer membrane beta-barrel domain-containing protein n=1 Tax=Paraburkholderia phymatum TaxID=148447 RepID=UPI00317C8D3C